MKFCNQSQFVYDLWNRMISSFRPISTIDLNKWDNSNSHLVPVMWCKTNWFRFRINYEIRKLTEMWVYLFTQPVLEN